MNKFGETVKKARKERNMTIKELADRVGMSANEIASIEKGKRVPRVTTISRIANALEFSYEQLLDIL